MIDNPSRWLRLPQSIKDLICARNAVRDHYRDVLVQKNIDACLEFTLDGKLVGDLGEAIAVEHFGIVLKPKGSTAGRDALAPDGRTVQIKSTGTGRGPAFRNTAERAVHLLFFEFDYESCSAELIFNGPEKIAFSYLPHNFAGQRSLTPHQIREADKKVHEDDRLRRILL